MRPAKMSSGTKTLRPWFYRSLCVEMVAIEVRKLNDDRILLGVGKHGRRVNPHEHLRPFTFERRRRP